MKVHKLTYALLILVFATLGLAVAKHEQPRRDPSREDEYLKQQQDKRLRFPVADYEEKDLADPKKNEALKQKKLRKNDFKLVARNPPSWQVERVVINEGGIDFPAFPVAESTVIILGTVTAAEAHLSENKKNVYSEFKVLAEKVFKSSKRSVVDGTELTVDRIGGYVKYPNGFTVLYHISGTNMPLTGERYLFFLTSKNQQDLSVLTAYEIGTKGVAPLDESPQFEQYRGISETALLQKLRDVLAQSSSH
jgi:hypothetical protein